MKWKTITKKTQHYGAARTRTVISKISSRCSWTAFKKKRGHYTVVNMAPSQVLWDISYGFCILLWLHFTQRPSSFGIGVVWPRGNTEGDRNNGGNCNWYWLSDLTLSTLFCCFRRPEEKSMPWDTHERPGINGDRPGFTAAVQRRGSAGWVSEWRQWSGRYIEKEHTKSKWQRESMRAIFCRE